MGSTTSRLGDLASNEFLQRFVGKESIKPEDPFWQQFLSFSFVPPRTAYVLYYCIPDLNLVRGRPLFSHSIKSKAVIILQLKTKTELDWPCSPISVLFWLSCACRQAFPP